MTTFLQSRDPARPALRQPVKMQLGLANFHDGATVVFLQVEGGDGRLFISPAEARMVAGQLVDQANAADEENGQIEPLPHPQNFLVGLRIGEEGRAVQVSVVPTWGPTFYTDSVGALNLARMLTERAHELLRANPLPEPCAECSDTGSIHVPGDRDQDVSTDCPWCTPGDPELSNH